MLRILRTPPKTRGLEFAIRSFVWGGPVVYAIHVAFRDHMGPDPAFFLHLLIFFPVELHLLGGLKSYRGGVPLLSRSRRKPMAAFQTTLATLWVLLWGATRVLAGIEAEIYATSAFFAFRSYVFLLLCSGLMCGYDEAS